MVQDLIVLDQSVPPTTRRYFRGRGLNLSSEKALPALLSETSANTITFVAKWGRLTTRVSHMLSEWALGHPDRGCGVLPVSARASAAPPLARNTVPPAIGIITGNGSAGFATPGGFYSSPSDCIVDAACSEEDLTGLALTGHGGEYCIQMGEAWLTTDLQASLPGGEYIRPESLRCRLIFLNTCSSLRMGDSVVPQVYSLAFALYDKGIPVIGTYRNCYTWPDASLLLAEALFAGRTLGQVVNELNAEAIRRGETRGQFLLLGDPTWELLPSAKPVRLTVHPPRGLTPDSLRRDSIFPSINGFDQLYILFRHFVNFSSDTEHTYHEFLAAARSVFLFTNASPYMHVDGSIWDDLKSAVRNSIERGRQALFSEIFSYLATSRWLESIYSPVCPRTEIATVACTACHSMATRQHYEPPLSHLWAIRREVCDRCGTTKEAVGNLDLDFDPIRATVRPHVLEVVAPPLPEESVGWLFVHRAAEVKPRLWPHGGGVVTFPITGLPFRGRVSVVGLTIGADALRASYKTVFVPQVEYHRADSGS